MKRLFSLLIASLLLSGMLLSLGACLPVDDYKVTVAYLSGSTGIGMAKMIDDDKEVGKYNFVSDYAAATNLRDALLAPNSKIDIATLPTNVAAQVYNKTNGKYRVVALNTLGVLYIATNGVNIDSLQDLVGKTVYVPEIAPAEILRHVLEVNGIPVYEASETANASTGVVFDRSLTLDSLPTALASRMKTDDGKYVEIGLLPEPKLTVAENQAKQKGTPLTVALDLTQEWNKKIDTPLVQGCIVASADFIDNHKRLLKEFLDIYEKSIDYMDNSDNIDSAADIVTSLKILPQKPVALKAIPRCNIAYIDGAEMKETLAAYLEALSANNLNLVGGKLPDDAFYCTFDNSGAGTPQ